MDFLEPSKVLKEFGVFGAQNVADFGAGAGHFTLEAAERLDGGRIFAIDIEKDMLSRLKSEAHERNHTHVDTIWGDLAKIGGVPITDQAFDKIIAVSILYTIDDKDAFVQETKRLVRIGGKVLLVDWKQNVIFGPHYQTRVAEEEALRLFRKHGFEKEKDIDAGQYHYGMILVRNQ